MCSISSPIQASNKGFVICKVNARVYAFVPCRGSSDCRLGCKWFVHSPSACLKLQDGGTIKEIGNAFQVKGELANVMTLTWLCPSCWLVMLHVIYQRFRCSRLSHSITRARFTYQVILNVSSKLPQSTARYCLGLRLMTSKKPSA